MTSNDTSNNCGGCSPVLSRDELEEMEFRLSVLHYFLPDAFTFPDFASSYSFFVRSLRERVHPLGIRDVREVKMESGLQFQVDLGDRLGCDFYYGFVQEYFDSQLFLGLLDSGSVVIDVGANFGYYAVSSAAKVGNDGAVYAFEPDRNAYELLQRNVDINGFHKIVSLHNICVGIEDGETDFCVCEESSFSGVRYTGRSKLTGKVRVPMRSLDSILRELGLSRIDALKIDVEGYEYGVLRGCISTLSNSANLVIMMETSSKNLNDENRQNLVSTFTDLYNIGFRGWILDSNPTGLSLLEKPDEIENVVSANVFLVFSDSERERQLHNVCQILLEQSFRGMARDIGLSAESLLRRNIKDPFNYSQVHGALLVSLINSRDSTIEYLKNRIIKCENKFFQSDKDLHKKTEELQKTEIELQKTEIELQKIGEELQKIKESRTYTLFARAARILGRLFLI